MMSKLKTLSEHFNKKEFAEVIHLIKTEAEFRFDLIENEEQAEVSALAAFSFFNLTDYKNTIDYALRSIKYLEGKGQVEAAHDLYENLIILLIDSYSRSNKHAKAYFLLSRKVSISTLGTAETLSRFDKLKDILSKKVSNFIGILLVIVGVLFVMLQMLFHPFSSLTYLIILLLLSSLVISVWVLYSTFVKIIRRML